MYATDEHGYPTPKSMMRIEDWKFTKRTDFAECFAFISDAWNHGYGRFERDGDKFTLATGGWSGNEDVIGSMERNFILWSLCWLSSFRGGLHHFELPKFRETAP